MTTRREFVQSLTAFAVTANMLERDAASAVPASVAPAAGHFRRGLGAISTDNAFGYGVRANATF